MVGIVIYKHILSRIARLQIERSEGMLRNWKRSMRKMKACTFNLLELRQYKNRLVSVKRMLVLNLPPFFPCRVGERKRAVISKQTCFSQKRVRSYNVLALEAEYISLELM